MLKLLYFALDSFTNDFTKRRVLDFYPQFVTDVDPDRLSDYLIQGSVISTEQWQVIHQENPARPARCRALLSHLFYTQHPKAFLVVRTALSAESHYLLELIEGKEPERGIDVHAEKQMSLEGYFLQFYIIISGD